MLFGREIVVDPAHGKLALDGQIQGPRKPEDVRTVAETLAAGGVGRGRVLAPYLRNQRVETQTLRIAETAGCTRTAEISRVSRAIEGDRSIVQVVSDIAGAGVRQ